MRTFHHISLYSLLTFILLLASAAPAYADVWNGVAVTTSLNGDGTAERPYEVATGADLKLVQSDPKYWKYGVHILQIDDIDLGGNELGIIGYGDGTKTNNDISNSAFNPFYATYDGGGHKISNLKIIWDIKTSTGSGAATWDTSNNYHYSAGLFGLLAGTVRNLHLDNAHATRTDSADVNNKKCDMRLGLIAGAAAPNKNGDKKVTIENIIISNSKIDDAKIETDLKTYFIGGVVGDVSCGYGGTSNISVSNYGNVYIRNIYADIDMDFNACKRTINDTGSITQFDIGGIVGRMRRGKYSDLPADVVFKGQIKAPIAAIAPYISMSRCNGTNNVNGMNDAYTGEVIKSNNTTSTGSFTKLDSHEVKVDGKSVYPNENRFFSDYKIWDSKNGEFVEITNSYPPADENRNGIRTLEADGSTLTTNATPETMRSWQGVNHGSYINLGTNIGVTTATNRLNSLNYPVKFAWDGSTFFFSTSEQMSLARNTLHSFAATVYNDNRSAKYIYSWTLTDKNGQTHLFETTKENLSSFSSPIVDLALDNNISKLTITDDFRNYTKVAMTLYDDAGHSLASAEMDLPEFGVTFTRSVDTNAKQYTFSPVFTFDGEDLASDDPLLSNLTYEWNAFKWVVDKGWTDANSSISGKNNEQAVTVEQSFVGSVRLVISDPEITDKVYYLTGDGTVNYMEQVLEQFRLSFTMEEIKYVYDSETDTYIETYVTFNPADYFTGSTGYAVGYDYSTGAADKSDIVIIDHNKEQHYLSKNNTRGTLKDTQQKPLIFKATVVDQFGNVQPYDANKYKVQWTFKIPDSREERKDPNEHPKAWKDDFDSDTKLCTIKEVWDYNRDNEYNSVNGQFPDIESDVTGNGIDWVGDYYRNAGNTTPQWACDRWGEYAVVNATTFKIHPNLLHCTSGFDVRAVLYDVSDSDNPTSIETIFSFSQVDFNTETVDGGYKATVCWRADDTAYTSSSKYSFKWYSNPDPTDYDGWTLVEGAGVDYITYGFPADYDGDRRRFSVITGVKPNLFYKVEFRTSSGTFIEGIMGPENVIFVYDRAKTLENPNYHDFDVFDVQTNYYFPQGNDANHGRDPWHAVATMAQAFKLLDAAGSYKTNRIVVMGFYHEFDGQNDKDYFMHSSWWEKVAAKPTTISGAYGGFIKGGTLGLGFNGSLNQKPFDAYLMKPMRMENLTLFTYNTHNSNQNCIYACNHDFTVGEGVRLINFNALTTGSGLATGVYVPNLTIVAGHYDYMASSKPWSDPFAEMNGQYKIDYTGNEVEGVTTIKILSGGFGRIIGASRNSGSRKVPALFGTPDNPNRSRIEINISHEPGKEKEYLPDWTVLKLNDDGSNTVDTKVTFNRDLGIVVGGQTDGSTFSDTEITIRNARVARYVSGNITFGRPVTVYDISYNYLPDDAYFGRTVLNIYGGAFDEIYGGSLGRSGFGGDKMVKAFFYGRSVINMYDGVIGVDDDENKTNANLFAAGAGGVIGLGNHWEVDGRSAGDERKTYTSDDRIPFLTGTGTEPYQSIEFRAFDEAKPDARLPKMKYRDAEGKMVEFDLTDSQVEINLYGGTIYGHVYGGGFGYASNLTYDRAPYRILNNTDPPQFQSLCGNLYGTSYVRLLPNPDPTKPDVLIYGNVYGAGAGDNTYITKSTGKTKTIDSVTYDYNFTEIAKTFGDMNVIIEAGHVMGEVFGGGCGIDIYGEMANIYGNANLEIKGGIIDGNVYGGAAFSDIRKYNYTDSSTHETVTGGGNTYTYIKGGIIGNCIFGGGKGIAETDHSTASNVSGDAHLVISGGEFSEEPYILDPILGQKKKGFNIYGGGFNNGTIRGDSYVNIKSSLLKSNASIDRPFAEAWNDILDRRFCVYGAGYGELTRVEGNTFVVVDIDPATATVEPSINDITELVPGQTIFDVAGGGYSGNTGYWVNTDGNAIYKLDTETPPEKYDYYNGGELHVNVKGYPFIRKIIGGSFYAECNNTNTFLESGSIKEVYGGALMGYVHDNAHLNIGTKVDTGLSSKGFETIIKLTDAATAANLNSHLFITGNVYGGNDVKGIVGTTFWTSDLPGESLGKRGKESTDQAPLFCSDVSEALNKGVTLFIHGGTIGGNVYGAGNGHYRGYYVPDWVRYDDGPDRHYRKVRLISDGGEVKYGKVYRCRPMTGSVTMHIGGNSETDRVNILGNLYGGGRSCTIGQWNTILPYEDPRRLVKAGFLHVNFGSHVNVNTVYMGAQGDDFMRPKELTKPVLKVGDGEFPTTMDLDDLGDIAYDHWYLTKDGTQYKPGFPPPGEVDGNYGMLGEHMLRGYAKNIEMNADIQLTFYSNPFRLDADGTPIMSADRTTVLCKKWLPAEKAHTDYDSSDVTFTNFFGGGASGFMTNNKLMRYNYDNGDPVPDITYNYYSDASGYGVNYDFHLAPEANIEKFGTIYRYSLPPGLKVLDRVVGGSEDAIGYVYDYNSPGDGTYTLTDNKLYTFEGGMVTQCSYTYDLIVHNDKYYAGYNNHLDHAIPAEHFAGHDYGDTYTIQNGPDAGKVIHRWVMPEKDINPNWADLVHRRYDLAYYEDPAYPGKKLAYCGPRESRLKGNETVLKLTVACQFDPQDGIYEPEDAGADAHEKHFGGVIYGGCFNSGVTQGDVIVSVSSDTTGGHHDSSDQETFGQISSLAHNVGRVFGGGFGSNSRVEGDTYVNLILGFVGNNVFGGGCQGNVYGTSHVKYVGNENTSYVFGAIYGGGLYGSVGEPGVTPVATDVRLFSGNADKVYGGSCLGDLYGRTNVELCDEVTTELEYFDYNKLLDNDDIGDWGGSRLIVGTVFGGNDIAGHITPQPLDPEDENYNKLDNFATYVLTYETAPPASASAEGEGEGEGESEGSGEGSGDSGEGGPGKQTPGSAGDYNGYPLIGYLYAGSNGNYGVHGKNSEDKDVYALDEKHNPTTVTFASGISNGVMHVKLSGETADDAAQKYPAFEIPHVTRSCLDIKGGTIINAYGGGDRATITEKTEINVNYQHDSDIMDARAGFFTEDDFVRTWNTFHLSHIDQMDNITFMCPDGKGGSDRVFRYHVFRLFGGNDKASMAIQPTWNLVSGHLGNVYSGGNFGDMTYCSRDDDGKPVGLTLTVDSRHFHANAVYGGGRVGDIIPDVASITPDSGIATIAEGEGEGSETDEFEDFYGATLIIKQGVVDHVYGGNDVSGTINYGTRVLISGAISGDVYAAGNGDYLYKYDPDFEGSSIEEDFHPELGRYFRIPRNSKYGDSNVEKLLAINKRRPNVDRSYINIEGTRGPDTTDKDGNTVKGQVNYAYVRGNVYCGGNSSTVGVGVKDDSKTSGITFEIGKYAMLNGVFLGSNGENLVDPSMMQAFEEINTMNLAAANDALTDGTIANNYVDDDDETAFDLEVLKEPSLFPNLLDVYMRAVDVYSTPSDFKLDPDNLEESYIGDFFVGGNRGSMLTDKTISLTFPNELVIFGKIVGGSNNANVTYKGVKHTGGLTREIPLDADGNQPDKVYLQVLSKFEPWKMTYPAKNLFGETDYRVIKVVPDVDVIGDRKYFPESKCSIFGGCFNSGRTVGNIHIDLYSDLAGEYPEDSEIYKQIEELYNIGTGDGDKSKERIIINGIDRLQRRSFALIGGGYGRETSVLGNIRLHLLPGKFHPSFNASRNHNEDPSAATIFAGSEKGDVIGNTEITVRDGVVLSNLYGGSESSTLYGSTNIIIGWPQYFICKKTARYDLNRTDNLSRAARGVVENAPNSNEPDPVKKEIWLCKGDYVSINLFRQFSHTQTDTDLVYVEPSNEHPYGNFKYNDECVFEFVDDDTPEKYAAHNNSPYVEFHNITWDDINIYIGNNKSRLSSRAEYYAHGNIYGGGFITANSGTTLAGDYTVRKFDKDHTPDPSLIGYGGNSTILIWDNPDNAILDNRVGEQVIKTLVNGKLKDTDPGAIVRDHITIGTGHYKPVVLQPGQDAMGYYQFVEDPNGRYQLEVGENLVTGSYVHQSSHIVDTPTTYYEIESDGGIYGGGRKVYVQGFRNCDLAYYGYADYTPQYPKLLNTAQRLDLFTLTDCCLMMQGAVDFAGNSIDATRYSMTRVKELEMRSSIDPSSDLEPGQRDGTALANVIHNTPRMRNYLAFFHDVLYVSAMTSSDAFSNPYRGANGKKGYKGNFTKTGTEEAEPVIPKDYNYTDYNYTKLTYDSEAPYSYKQFKTNRIRNYYANRNLPNMVEVDDGSGNKVSVKLLTSKEFDQRNIGTAANMIGINNGYTLKVQGAVVNESGKDEIYYGPVNGVFEVKLMTLATDEGGGYIYALNQHDDPNHFLETTGNFVFPGAAYLKSSQDPEKEENYNYVYDDCFPMGKGWDSYWGWDSTDPDETTSSMGPGRYVTDVTTASTDLDPDGNVVCDDPKNGNEVHYWYVNGSNFYFNVTLTAYTYKDPQYFHLNNNEDLIYLYGITGDSTITLDSAAWTPKSVLNVDGYDSDLQNLENHPADYQIFLSIDDQPGVDHTVGGGENGLGTHPDPNHAYITRVPRADLSTVEDAENGTVTVTTADGLYNAAETVTNYGSYTVGEGDAQKTVDNSPLLGITLYDKCDNTEKGYYEDHLSKDETVRLVLKAKDSTDPNELTFQYIINLTLKYVKGPTIDGFLQIENDALPGEYIYANAYDVNVDIDDENMGINGRNWYIVDKNCEINSNTDIQNYLTEVGAAACINGDLISENDRRQVHIPAYRYRDGWNVVYEIVANGLSFFVTPETTKAAEGSEGEGEGEGSGESAVGKFYPCLQVHNYHRMKPLVPMSSTPETTRLAEGDWIYIEDDADMAYFFEWLKGLQADDCAETVDGVATVNPQYAAGLTVQLMKDVRMPNSLSADVDLSKLRFDGTFHGNGHNIEMGDNTLFLGENYGTFYNTGFISSYNQDASVFSTNAGTVDCCFFYNDTNAAKGKMVSQDANTGTIENSYTSSLTDANAMTYASPDDFRYGRVAYDLNRFYLRERYNRAKGDNAGTGVETIRNKFRDGEYRYGGVYSEEYPFLLRTADVPNYHDYLGLRVNATPDQVTSGEVRGTIATMHNIEEPVDESRAVYVDDKFDHYEPLFESDYLFFGQDLTYGTSDLYPHAAYTTTRVYRASGFYGSKVDEGFHFNRTIQALHPGLTAVDFSGVRDAAHGNTYTATRTNYDDQKVWYAPQLDLPALADCTFDVGSRLEETSAEPAPERQITHNLLVYRNEDTMDYLDDFQYDTKKPFEEVYCHVIDVPDPANLENENAPNADYVQLVDYEDFNAPIPFDVNKTIWYRRSPALWADNSDGWEGICLPFTANITYGSVKSRVPDSPKNHGLMTHFYGEPETLDPASDDGSYSTRETHEYWLRKYTGMKDDKAYFDRPASNADKDNPEDKKYSKYHYSNEYFLTAYGDLRYDETGTKHIAPAYTAKGTDYDDYTMLTAHYPYLVSFPGRRYYEFDCSGEFYSDQTGEVVPDPQIITFAWDKGKAEDEKDRMTIPVTDDSLVEFKHDGLTFVGTFKRCKATANDVVVDVYENASRFIHPEDDDDCVVMPFRAYLKGTSDPIQISTRGVDSIGDGDDSPEEEYQQDATESLQIFLDGRTLVIENPYDYSMDVRLCDVAGRVLRLLNIHPGENRYENLDKGIYLLESFKFYIR